MSSVQVAAQQFKAAVVTHAPMVLTGLAIVIGGWLAARIARRIVRGGLSSLRLDSALEGSRIHGLVSALGKDWSVSRVVGQIVYFAVLLFTANTAAGTWGLTGLQAALSSAIGYLPKALAALGLLAGGTYVAGVARRSVGSVLRQVRSPLAGLLETATESALLVIVGLVACDMLGVNLGFITSNLTLLIGAVLVVVIFLACWSMRAPAEQLVANYYLRRLLSVGDHVETKSQRGTVVEFVPLGLVLREATGDEVFVPARELLAGLKRRQALRPDSPVP